MKILLIDDNPSMRSDVLSAINTKIKELGLTVEVEVLDENNLSDFLPNRPSVKETHAPEDLLAEVLSTRRDIDLIVVDHDLTALESNLSEPVVSIASHAASIPLCRYARVKRNTTMSKLTDALEAGTTFSVKINIDDLEKASLEILEVLDGFKKIKEEVNKLTPVDLNNGPASILSTILGDKTQEDYIAQYSISANIMGEILELYAVEQMKGFTPEEFIQIKKDRLAFILGYWLYNSILRFPGIILNKKATCSFLNIRLEDFDKYKDCFDAAKYTGFFAIDTEYWWKDRLNSILDKEEVWSGKELLEKKGHTVNSCKCIYDEASDAGYYCVIKEEPVSLEKSVGGISWLPSGAVLCRVGEEPYEQFAPLLGLA